MKILRGQQAVVSLGVIIQLSACAPHGDQEEESVVNTTQAFRSASGGRAVPSRARAEGAVRKHNLPLGTWRSLGKMKQAEDWERPPVRTSPVEEEEPVQPSALADVAANEPMAIGFDDGSVYTVSLSDAELSEIRRVLVAEGLSAGRPGDNDAPGNDWDEEFVPKAWSNGDDDRSLRGINEWGMDELYNRIGQLRADCTATLVGGSQSEYYYITASHCIFSRVTGVYLKPSFYPRRDGCKDKKGNSLDDCDATPFGVWSSSTWMTYQYFVDNCRTGSWTHECQSRDIAVVRVNKPSGESFPGALGFGSYSNSYIKDRPSYLRGYPNCGEDGDPDDTGGCASSSSVCRLRTLYGTSGTIGDTYNSGRRSKFNMATSAGMSGSALYIYQDGAKVYAVFSSEKEGCHNNCNTSKPNTAARITDTFEGWMLNFMGL